MQRRILLGIVSAVLIVSTVTIFRLESQLYARQAPVCIVVHPNGAPAPASCSDPDSYQVTP